MIKLGIDVGGTFTDLVVIDEKDGVIHQTKVASTPVSPDRGVMNGIEKVARMFSVNPAGIDFLIHGTTVATNALIERKGSRMAYVTTRGFRDVLHIARQSRPKLYDFFERRPDPFIPRDLRFEVPERTLYDGQIREPLDEEAVREIGGILRREGIGVAAVCLLHAYANPAHELRVRELLTQEAPGLIVCLSSEVLPEFKEYERASTTVINAYVMPVVERYLGNILAGIKRMGVRSDLHIMQSNGGVMTSQTAGRKSVHTVLSGPAAGVLGGLVIARLAGYDSIITIDMGGTSFDVSLVNGGRLTFANENEIGGHVIKVPMIDIKTLGAGGGSIAWVDAGGALQVGPESAGADPGPACYGHGGREPTVSDANLVLGYLNAGDFAGGDMRLDPELARRAIRERIAEPMGLSVLDAAEGILRVVNSTMIRGIRLVSVERGHDPREFALVCFGGAGPVHAVSLAKALQIPRLIIPEAPGVNCALGLLMADFRHDYSKTFLHAVRDLDPERLNAEFAALEAAAAEQLTGEGIARNDIVCIRSGDLRYTGQGYELETPLPLKAYAAEDLKDICAALSAIHREKYGYAMPDDTVEIVNLRLTAIGLLTKPSLREEPYADADASPAIKEYRKVYMDGGFAEVPVYDRKMLKCGNVIASPAIVDQSDSTTVLFRGYRATVDRYRNLIVEKEDDAHAAG